MPWSSWATSRATAQQACLAEAQSSIYWVGMGPSEEGPPAELVAAYARCGVDLSAVGDDAGPASDHE